MGAPATECRTFAREDSIRFPFPAAKTITPKGLLSKRFPMNVPPGFIGFSDLKSKV